MNCDVHLYRNFPPDSMLQSEGSLKIMCDLSSEGVLDKTMY